MGDCVVSCHFYVHICVWSDSDDMSYTQWSEMQNLSSVFNLSLQTSEISSGAVAVGSTQ